VGGVVFHFVPDGGEHSHYLLNGFGRHLRIVGRSACEEFFIIGGEFRNYRASCGTRFRRRCSCSRGRRFLRPCRRFLRRFQRCPRRCFFRRSRLL
jgi:hypothetical protein